MPGGWKSAADLSERRVDLKVAGSSKAAATAEISSTAAMREINRLSLTWWEKGLQSLFNVRCGCLADGLELLVVGNFHIWPDIVRSEVKVDVQILVAEDCLLFAKDWVGEGRVEGVYGVDALSASSDERDLLLDTIALAIIPCSSSLLVEKLRTK